MTANEVAGVTLRRHADDLTCWISLKLGIATSEPRLFSTEPGSIFLPFRFCRLSSSNCHHLLYFTRFTEG
jgi:hypothetical protein